MACAGGVSLSVKHDSWQIPYHKIKMWSKNFRSRRSPVELAARTHNRRRERDPLGQGQPCTWRTRLVKVAALVYESTRRVVVRLSSSWPYLGHYH